MTEAVYVEVLDPCGSPLGSGRVVLWCQTTIRTKAGGSSGGKSWDDEYGQAPCVVLETERGFKSIPLADKYGQATIRKIQR